MSDITPQYNILSSRDKIQVPELDYQMGDKLGGQLLASDARYWGEGENVGVMDENGLYIGSTDYSTAPFWVDMEGNVTASSLVISGGTLKYGKTSFTDSANAGYYLGSEGWYVGSAADATKLKYTLADGTISFKGTIDGASTLGGRIASVVANAIDAAGHFADAAIDTANKNILGEFTFGASGALQIGTYAAGVTGDIKISPSGILGRDKDNNTTFSIDATTGIAVLNGLVVGTNVGLGTAQDSAGVTTIIGSTVTTSFVNALSVVAGSVAAENITGTTITGKTLRTAASPNKRIEASQATNTLTAYDSSNIIKGLINGTDGSTIFGRTIDSDYAAEFIKDDGSSGDVADTGDVALIQNQGQGRGLVISNINSTANGVNLDISVNQNNQPKLSMGNADGLPTTGTHSIGDEISISGVKFICVTAGTPGVFRSIDGNFIYATAGEDIGDEDWVGFGDSTSDLLTTVDKDAYVDQEHPDSEYGAATTIKVGEVDSLTKRVSGLIRFDLTNAKGANDKVTAATLKLKIISNNIGNGYMQMDIYRINAAWTESTVDWTSMPSKDSTVLATVDIAYTASGWVDVDITDLYLDWVNGIVNNDYGIYLQFGGGSITGTADHTITFGSSDGAEINQPYIDVTYHGDMDRVYKTTTNAPNDTFKVVGLMLDDKDEGEQCLIQCAGNYKRWTSSTLVPGARYYLTTTGGSMSTTPETLVKPVAKAISETEIMIDIQPGYCEHQFKLAVVDGAPYYLTGAPYTNTGFYPSRCEILAQVYDTNARSFGTQIGDNASCQATNNGLEVSHSTTYSFNAYSASTDQVVGDLTLHSAGYRMVFHGLSTNNYYSYLTIKSFE